MALPILDQARRSFSRKRYNDVINLLEPEVIKFRDSFFFYYILGLSCLHTGDIGGANSYFQRARQIKMRDPDLLAAQAVLFLRRGDTQQAVDYYLEILEYTPGHKLARKSLNFIRKKGDEDTIMTLAETGKIERFFPVLPQKFPLGKMIGVLAFFAIISIGLLLFPQLVRSAHNNERADLSSLSLDISGRTELVDMGGSYAYVLTAKDIIRSYEAARNYFLDYRDNPAQVEINRLLNSNASTTVKQKARILMTYLSIPGFDTLKDSYPFSVVSAELSLYQDCWVSWKGMGANVRYTDNTTDFDLLVGYDTRNRLEGFVPVHFSDRVTIDPEKPLEVLGEITVENGKLTLAGLSVYQSAQPVKQGVQ